MNISVYTKAGSWGQGDSLVSKVFAEQAQGPSSGPKHSCKKAKWGNIASSKVGADPYGDRPMEHQICRQSCCLHKPHGCLQTDHTSSASVNACLSAVSPFPESSSQVSSQHSWQASSFFSFTSNQLLILRFHCKWTQTQTNGSVQLCSQYHRLYLSPQLVVLPQFLLGLINCLH